MDFKVSNNMAEVTRGLSDVARKELPWAMVRALNDTAKYVIEYNRRAMAKAFDKPTRWTLNAFRIQRANKRTLDASVLRKTTAGKRHYLEVQEAGGVKPQGGLELAMQHRATDAGKVGRVTPAAKAQRDASGNLARGEIKRIFTKLDAAHAGKRKRKGSVQYFTPKAGQLSPGVWRRQGSSLKPVLHFRTKAPTYRPRLNFYRNANKVAQAKFEKLFLKYLQEQTRPKG